LACTWRNGALEIEQCAREALRSGVVFQQPARGRAREHRRAQHAVGLEDSGAAEPLDPFKTLAAPLKQRVNLVPLRFSSCLFAYRTIIFATNTYS
jgi:hypothetical protein